MLSSKYYVNYQDIFYRIDVIFSIEEEWIP